MSAVLAKIFGGMGGEIIKSLDGLFTSDDERLKAKVLIDQVVNVGKKDVLNATAKQEAELTRRHELDMGSDSTLSKNVRPASLVYLLVVVSVLAVTDGNLSWDEWAFSVKDNYIDLFQILLVTAFAFYFGGRSVEKVTKVAKQFKARKKKKVEEWVSDSDGD